MPKRPQNPEPDPLKHEVERLLRQLDAATAQSGPPVQPRTPPRPYDPPRPYTPRQPGKPAGLRELFQRLKLPSLPHIPHRRGNARPHTVARPATRPAARPAARHPGLY